jgi:hypothetical protein
MMILVVMGFVSDGASDGTTLGSSDGLELGELEGIVEVEGRNEGWGEGAVVNVG